MPSQAGAGGPPLHPHPLTNTVDNPPSKLRFLPRLGSSPAVSDRKNPSRLRGLPHRFIRQIVSHDHRSPHRADPLD